MDWFLVVFVKFSIFLAVPLFIETVFPEWAVGRASLMLTLAVGAFEGVGTGLTLLHFKSRWVDFVIGFATLCKFSIVDSLVWAIAFDALCLLYSTNASSVAPLLAIFALGNTWIYVGTSNGRDEPSYVESLVDEGFNFEATLSISDVNLYDSHVGFRWDLDNSWFES